MASELRFASIAAPSSKLNYLYWNRAYLNKNHIYLREELPLFDI